MYLIMRGKQIVLGTTDYNKALRISEDLNSRKIDHEIVDRTDQA